LGVHLDLVKTKQTFFKFYELKIYIGYYHVKVRAQRAYGPGRTFVWSKWIDANNPYVNTRESKQFKTKVLNATRRGENLAKIQSRFGDFLFLVRDAKWSTIYDLGARELNLFLDSTEAHFAEFGTDRLLDALNRAVDRIREAGFDFKTVDYRVLVGHARDAIQGLPPPASIEDGNVDSAAETEIDEENREFPVFNLSRG
jgi:hypothetical protein